MNKEYHQFAYLDNMLRPNQRLSLSILIAWGTVVASTMGCSIQKRTHLPGFHVEHKSRPSAQRAVNPVQTLHNNNRTSQEPMQETLALTSSLEDVMVLETAEDRAMAGFTLNELESTVVTSISRPSCNPGLMHSPRIHPLSTGHVSPEIDMDEARALARKEARLSFALGIFILLPLGVIIAVGALIGPTSVLNAVRWGLLGLAFIVSGFKLNRIADDDAKLASWYQKRWQANWRKALLIVYAITLIAAIVVGGLFWLLW